MRRRDLIAALQNQPLDVIARLLDDAGYKVRHYPDQSVQEHGGGMLTDARQPRRQGRLMVSREIPQLMTANQIAAETGLPRSVVRSIMSRCLRVNGGSRRLVVRRSDVLRVLREDPPRGV